MMQLYQEILMDHYRNPRHGGTLENPDFSSQEVNPSCGDSVSFQGIISNDRLDRVAFVGKGCVISLAGASLLAEYCHGKTVTEILALAHGDMIKLIALPLGPIRLKCALLPLQALQQGIRSYQQRVKGGNA